MPQAGRTVERKSRCRQGKCGMWHRKS